MPYFGRNKKFFLIEGSITACLGILAMSWPMISSLAVEILFGWILLLAGVTQLFRLFQIKNIPGNILGILLAILYLVGGGIFLTHPLAGLKTLTLVLTLLFLVQASFHGFIALRIHAYPYKIWNIFAGCVAFILSCLIFIGWPENSVWILGFLTGINLTFIGVSHLLIGISIKN